MVCAEVEELAPELALGTLPGDQRAAVLAHLEGCIVCRRLVKELSDTADALLLVAPEVEPPAGFGRRVLREMRPPRRHQWRPVAAVALALVVGLVIGFIPGHLGSGSRAAVRVASFVPAAGESLSGRVYARAGGPSWLFMTVTNSNGEGDTYACELVLKGGRRLTIGSFPMRDGSGSWGRSVDVGIGDIASVRLVNPSGRIAATAALGEA
jgi:hypothetical protein